MEKGQDAENLVVPVEHEDLRNLLNVRRDVVMREHDALGVSGAAAGKDDGGQVVDIAFAGYSADGFAQKRLRCCACEQEREELLGGTRRLEDIFEKQGA